MQPFTHSPFLQALGYAIAHSLWQVSLVWGAVSFINNFAKFSSTLKYHVALSAQLLSFCWFLFTFSFYYQRSAEAFASIQFLRSEDIHTIIFAPHQQNFSAWLLAVLIRVEASLPFLSIAYLFLFFILLFRWIKSYNCTKHLQTNGLEKIDIEWKMFVKKMSDRLGINQEIKIYISHLVSSPLTIGFIKPVILIPLASINNLSIEQMEAVILHELAHIKRFDYVVNLVLSIVELALFFNPFTLLISRIIKKERENSCDDWVLQFQYKPAMYAEALLTIAYLQPSSGFAMHAVHNKQDLLFRVKRMLEKKERFNYKQQLVALFLLTGIFCSVAWFQPNGSKAVNGLRLSRSISPEPLTAKVINPLLNPLFFLAKPNAAIAKIEVEHPKHLSGDAGIRRKSVDVNITTIPPADIEQLHKLDRDPIRQMGDYAANEAAFEAKENNFTFFADVVNNRSDSSSSFVKPGRRSRGEMGMKKMGHAVPFGEGFAQTSQVQEMVALPGEEAKRQLINFFKELPSLSVMPDEVKNKIRGVMSKMAAAREASRNRMIPAMYLRLDGMKTRSPGFGKNRKKQRLDAEAPIPEEPNDMLTVDMGPAFSERIRFLQNSAATLALQPRAIDEVEIREAGVAYPEETSTMSARIVALPVTPGNMIISRKKSAPKPREERRESGLFQFPN